MNSAVERTLLTQDLLTLLFTSKISRQIQLLPVEVAELLYFYCVN